MGVPTLSLNAAAVEAAGVIHGGAKPPALSSVRVETLQPVLSRTRKRLRISKQAVLRTHLRLIEVK